MTCFDRMYRVSPGNRLYTRTISHTIYMTTICNIRIVINNLSQQNTNCVPVLIMRYEFLEVC